MKYIGKKIVTLIMTLFLVSVAAFLAFQVIPGDVVTSILGTEATPEREEQLREELESTNLRFGGTQTGPGQSSTEILASATGIPKT